MPREDCAGALAKALLGKGWLRPEHRVGDPRGYMRHLLYVDPQDRFVITAITWLPGQVSPVHGHQVWCAYGVAEGELLEEQFEEAAGTLRILKESLYAPGEVADLDREAGIIHRVANRGRVPVVSLHAYGVSAARLTTGINRVFSTQWDRSLAIVVLSSLALKGVLEEFKPLFEQSLAARLDLRFDATQAILAQLAAGARADLLVLTAEAMNELRQRGQVAQVRSLGASGVGIAVRAGAPRPDIGSVEALKRTLAAAQSVAHSKVGASGIYFAALLDELGIQLKKRVVVEKGPVGRVVAAGEAELGVQQLCELAPVPGIDIVGPLPGPVQKLTRFAAGIPAHAANPQGGRMLMELLGSDAARAGMVRGGMQPEG